ncbi:MAG: site-2 protease family protein [Clostridia bacterium]|nr:site-2 protease family protein [Clostridia bacterium]
MIADLIRTGDMSQVFIGLLVSVFAVFCVFPIHEYAHAFVATKLGDDTPRLRGRLTLNPLAHIDIIGALMILIVGFGYAKPVPVNARRFKNPKAGMALTALAGPVSNLLMAFIFSLVGNIISFAAYKAGVTSDLFRAVILFTALASQINVGLAVFNLLPIPPLDGSKILALVIPPKYYFKYLQYERYIIIGVFLLIFIGVLDIPLSFLTGIIYRGINFAAGLPFRFLIS